MATVSLLFKLLFIFISCCAQSTTQALTLPPITLQALSPQGFRVSIPDDGFSFFGFRGNLNEEMEDLETGTWIKDIARPTDGQWTFKDSKVKLKIGDTIYYWTIVIKNGMSHRQGVKTWTVTELVKEGAPVITTAAPPRTTESTTTTAASCQQSQSVVFGMKRTCKGDLIFVEEFDKSSIKGLTNWDPEVMFPLEPDYPFNVYMADSLKVENGILSISPSLLESHYHEGFLFQQLDLTSSCTGQKGTRQCKQVATGAQILPPVRSGKLTTRMNFSFKFGRVEIRAKVPDGSWLIPEITLEPRDAVYGKERYESGLMRIAYVRGNSAFAKRLYGGPVLSDREPQRSSFLKERIGIDNWYKDFHNYTLVWKPDGLQLLVDGEQYGTVDPGEGFSASRSLPDAALWTRGTIMAPLDEMFYVSLGLRAGGINDFADSPDKPWRNSNSKAMLNFWNARDDWYPTWTDADLKVDSVRIYAL